MSGIPKPVPLKEALEGKTIEQVAEEFKVNKSTIRIWFAKTGATRLRKRRDLLHAIPSKEKLEGKSYVDVAQEYKVTRPTALLWFYKTGAIPSDAKTCFEKAVGKIAHLKAEDYEGKTFHELMDQCGVSKQAVFYHAAELGMNRKMIFTKGA